VRTGLDIIRVVNGLKTRSPESLIDVSTTRALSLDLITSNSWSKALASFKSSVSKPSVSYHLLSISRRMDEML
jgi:hypothetical protein